MFKLRVLFELCVAARHYASQRMGPAPICWKSLRKQLKVRPIEQFYCQPPPLCSLVNTFNKDFIFLNANGFYDLVLSAGWPACTCEAWRGRAGSRDQYSRCGTGSCFDKGSKISFENTVNFLKLRYAHGVTITFLYKIRAPWVPWSIVCWFLSTLASFWLISKDECKQGSYLVCKSEVFFVAITLSNVETGALYNRIKVPVRRAAICWKS